MQKIAIVVKGLLSLYLLSSFCMSQELGPAENEPDRVKAEMKLDAYFDTSIDEFRQRFPEVSIGLDLGETMYEEMMNLDSENLDSLAVRVQVNYNHQYRWARDEAFLTYKDSEYHQQLLRSIHRGNTENAYEDVFYGVEALLQLGWQDSSTFNGETKISASTLEVGTGKVFSSHRGSNRDNFISTNMIERVGSNTNTPLIRYKSKNEAGSVSITIYRKGVTEDDDPLSNSVRLARIDTQGDDAAVQLYNDYQIGENWTGSNAVGLGDGMLTLNWSLTSNYKDSIVQHGFFAGYSDYVGDFRQLRQNTNFKGFGYEFNLSSMGNGEGLLAGLRSSVLMDADLTSAVDLQTSDYLEITMMAGYNRTLADGIEFGIGGESNSYFSLSGDEDFNRYFVGPSLRFSR